MGAVDRAAADIERRAEPTVYFEVLASDCATDDVHDRVYGSDFVEVHLLDRHGVDAGFGFPKKLEGSGGAGLYRLGQRR